MYKLGKMLRHARPKLQIDFNFIYTSCLNNEIDYNDMMIS